MPPLETLSQEQIQLAKDLLEVEDWFTYHAPDPEQVTVLGVSRGYARAWASYIVTHIKPSRERSIFLTELRKVAMLANQAVIFDRS